MGYIPPPMPQVPDGATFEERLRMYELYALSLANGLMPWHRKKFRERILANVAEFRIKGPPKESG